MQTSNFTFGPVRIMEGIYMADDFIAEVKNIIKRILNLWYKIKYQK